MADNLQAVAPEIEVKPSMTADDLYNLISTNKDTTPSQPITSDSLYNLIQQSPKAEEEKMPWSDVAAQAFQNVIPSGIEMGKNLAHAVAHPIQTVDVISDIAAGAVNKVLPKPLQEASKKFDVAVLGEEKAKEFEHRSDELANAIGKFYKDRYGSAEGFKKALAQDPVGVASDLSAVLTGGAGIASKAGLPEKVVSTLQKAGEVTNPILATAKVGTKVGKTGLGLLTEIGRAHV